jgi:hypothetical protein
MDIHGEVHQMSFPAEYPLSGDKLTMIRHKSRDIQNRNAPRKLLMKLSVKGFPEKGEKLPLDLNSAFDSPA